MGVLAGTDTHVKDISDTGLTVGYSNPGTIGYAWSSANGLRTLLPLSGSFSSAEAVNSQDEVVGQYGGGTDSWHAFLWTSQSGMIDVSPPGWTDTKAYGINDWGWIVGAGIAPNGQPHGFVLIPEPTTVGILTCGWIFISRRRLTKPVG